MLYLLSLCASTQAQKRKLGLVDDDTTKLEEEGFGEGKSTNNFAKTVNIRGEFVVNDN